MDTCKLLWNWDSKEKSRYRKTQQKKTNGTLFERLWRNRQGNNPFSLFYIFFRHTSGTSECIVFVRDICMHYVMKLRYVKNSSGHKNIPMKCSRIFLISPHFVSFSICARVEAKRTSLLFSSHCFFFFVFFVSPKSPKYVNVLCKSPCYFCALAVHSSPACMQNASLSSIEWIRELPFVEFR